MHDHTEDWPPRMVHHPLWFATQTAEQLHAMADHLQAHAHLACEPTDRAHLFMAAVSGLQHALFGVMARLPGASGRDLLAAMALADARATQLLQDEQRAEDAAGA